MFKYAVYTLISVGVFFGHDTTALRHTPTDVKIIVSIGWPALIGVYIARQHANGGGQHPST